MTQASPFRSALRATAAAALALTLAGCATPGGTTVAEGDVSDPLEPMNRAIFTFNEAADKVLLRPVAEGYTYVVPDPVRASVQSFLRNLLSPLHLGHQILQGDIEGVKSTTARFITNTVLGAGGIADVATSLGIKYEPEDAGQTLAVWGAGPGPYLVLPLFGPSNIRDAVGLGVDAFGDPISVWGKATHHSDWLWARTGTTGVDSRSRVLKEVDELRKSSLDFYATVRSLYSQQRNSQIRDQQSSPQQLEFPDYITPGQTK